LRPDSLQLGLGLGLNDAHVPIVTLLSVSRVRQGPVQLRQGAFV
jgi:hypothetical protein